MVSPSKLGVVVRLAQWLYSRRVSIALVTSAVLLVFFSNFFDWALNIEAAPKTGIAGGLLVFASIALCWYGVAEQSALSGRIDTLTAQNAELSSSLAVLGNDYFDIWTRRLREIAEELEFDGSDRVSVYRYDSAIFTMVGRYSVQPDLCKKGRGIYPSNQGVIGHAWRSAEGCAVADLPDPATEPVLYRAQNVKDWGIPAQVVNGLSMKPRSLAAFTLDHPHTRQRCAILVFESKRPNRFSKDTLAHLVNGRLGKDIAFMLELMRSKEPSLAFAQKQGF